MTDRVKCIECDTMILPRTAADNGGLCEPCAQLPPELRAMRRKFAAQLADGSVFTPSDRERAGASVPEELWTGRWQLQPEYYANSDVDSPRAAVAAARSKPGGHVFLVTESGGELNLGFNARYGVCEYHNRESGEFRCAYTPSNLREQAPEELHLEQACPCCGVGMAWYPSRYHMPRDLAFSIIDSAVANRRTSGVEWLEADDFSDTGCGRG
jgi:hypothetical protein